MSKQTWYVKKFERNAAGFYVPTEICDSNGRDRLDKKTYESLDQATIDQVGLYSPFEEHFYVSLPARGREALDPRTLQQYGGFGWFISVMERGQDMRKMPDFATMLKQYVLEGIYSREEISRVRKQLPAQDVSQLYDMPLPVSPCIRGINCIPESAGQSDLVAREQKEEQEANERARIAKQEMDEEFNSIDTDLASQLNELDKPLRQKSKALDAVTEEQQRLVSIAAEELAAAEKNVIKFSKHPKAKQAEIKKVLDQKQLNKTKADSEMERKVKIARDEERAVIADVQQKEKEVQQKARELKQQAARKANLGAASDSDGIGVAGWLGIAAAAVIVAVVVGVLLKRRSEKKGIPLRNS
jgi:hypothetical protein